jgi:hypothetical protein
MDQTNLRIPDQLRIQLRHILLNHITQLSAPLDPRRPTPNHRKIQQHPLHLLAGRRQTRRLKAAQQPIANLPRIRHILQKVRMLPHALGPKRLRIAPHGNNQLVPPHLKHLPLRPLSLHFPRPFLPRERNALRRLIDRLLDLQRSLVEVYAICPALEELRSFFGSFAGAGGFQCAAEFERSDGGGGQEGGEDEVGARGDDDDLVFVWV